MTPEEIEAYVDAAAAALALPIAPEHRPGVLAYFALAAGYADLVNMQTLRPEDESAAGFLPVTPRSSAT